MGNLSIPFVDADWKEIPNQRENLMREVFAINARPDHVLGLSIDLGGMLVLAGNEAGLAAFENSAPVLQERYPMRLPNHAGFHTHLQKPVSELGFSALPEHLFDQPSIPAGRRSGSNLASQVDRYQRIVYLYTRTSGLRIIRLYSCYSYCRTGVNARCVHNSRSRYHSDRGDSSGSYPI